MYLLESSALKSVCLVGMDETASAGPVNKALSAFNSLGLFFRSRCCLHLFQGGSKSSELTVISLVFHRVGPVTLE